MALGAGAALGLGPRLAFGATASPCSPRPIPSSGEKIPVIGLGSSATFRSVAESADVAGLREVLSAFVERGAHGFRHGAVLRRIGSRGRPACARARHHGEVLLGDEGQRRAARRRAADPAAARAQIEESFRRFGVETIDLIQVHNLGDLPVQLGILKELKAANACATSASRVRARTSTASSRA